jgi:hypothetical protein
MWEPQRLTNLWASYGDSLIFFTLWSWLLYRKMSRQRFTAWLVRQFKQDISTSVRHLVYGSVCIRLFVCQRFCRNGCVHIVADASILRPASTFRFGLAGRGKRVLLELCQRCPHNLPPPGRYEHPRTNFISEAFILFLSDSVRGHALQPLIGCAHATLDRKASTCFRAYLATPSVADTVSSGHKSQSGLDTKTYWLTDCQS